MLILLTLFILFAFIGYHVSPSARRIIMKTCLIIAVALVIGISLFSAWVEPQSLPICILLGLGFSLVPGAAAFGTWVGGQVQKPVFPGD